MEKSTTTQPDIAEVQALASKTLLGQKNAEALAPKLSLEDVKGLHLASQNALENLKTGQSLEWSNDKTKHGGMITPSRYYQTAEGAYCREFTQTLKLSKKQLETGGIACRNDKKIWILQE